MGKELSEIYVEELNRVAIVAREYSDEKTLELAVGGEKPEVPAEIYPVAHIFEVQSNSTKDQVNELESNTGRFCAAISGQAKSESGEGPYKVHGVYLNSKSANFQAGIKALDNEKIELPQLLTMRPFLEDMIDRSFKGEYPNAEAAERSDDLKNLEIRSILKDFIDGAVISPERRIPTFKEDGLDQVKSVYMQAYIRAANQWAKSKGLEVTLDVNDFTNPKYVKSEDAVANIDKEQVQNAAKGLVAAINAPSDEEPAKDSASPATPEKQSASR